MSVLVPPKLGASKRIFSIVWIIALVLHAAPLAPAQCPPGVWLPGPGLGIPGTNNSVYAITLWDPDGAGPSAPVWVVGGDFRLAGDVVVNHIATYNPATGQWSALGSGFNNWVMSLTTLPNGQLVAGGYFTSSGSVSTRGIARWNGTSWSPLSGGIAASYYPVVRALTTLPNGNLVAGGNFSVAGSVSVSNVALWNGTSWSAMGSGLGVAGNQNWSVLSLITLATGDVIAGGNFDTLGPSGTGAAAVHVARWSGTAWSPMGAGVNNDVATLAVLSSGEVVAAGGYPSSPILPPYTGPNYVRRWDGANWIPISITNLPYILSLLVLDNDRLIAGASNAIYHWDGTSWTTFTTLQNVGGGQYAFAIKSLGNDRLLVGGRFSTIGGVSALNFSHYDGLQWSALGTGTSGGIYAVSPLSNGEFVVGGNFTSFVNIVANGIVRWDGSNWTPLGTGVEGGQRTVYATTTLANGHLIAAGDFTLAGGVTANRIARWDGAAWAPIGEGMNAAVRAVIDLPDDNLIAGGDFTSAGGNACSRIARWNGSNWTPLGSGLNQRVNALALLPNGDIVAGGAFTTAGGAAANYVARWNGASWTALGDGTNNVVNALSIRLDGSLMVGGSFTMAGPVLTYKAARWNGTAWYPFSYGSQSNSAFAIAALPNGSLALGGDFGAGGGGTSEGLAVFSGTSWKPIGMGQISIAPFHSQFYALSATPNGDLLAGGRLATSGGQAYAYFGRYHQDGWPTISQHPTDATACVLGSTTFSVSATGPGPLTYRWQMLDANSPYVWINLSDGPITNGGQPIGIAGGATTPTLTIYAAIDSGNDIEARFRCIVSNSCASPASCVAALRVVPWGTGDGDATGIVDGRDIMTFVNIMTMGGGPGTGNCAVDMDFSGTVDSADVPLFIAALLTGS